MAYGITRSARLAALVLAASLALSAGLSLAGLPAAQLGGPTSHGGMVQAGSADVLIAGARAARVGDFAFCPQTAPVPHVGGPISTGSATVFVNGVPAARQSSLVSENGGQVSQLTGGSSTVLIGN